jgi:hypothetical protein
MRSKRTDLRGLTHLGGLFGTEGMCHTCHYSLRDRKRSMASRSLSVGNVREART